MMQKKKAGIIGGLGPASTLEYYRGIVQRALKLCGNEEYPEIVITSVNMTEILKMVEEKAYDQLTMRLYRAVQDLQAAGADFVAIASNTPHVVFDQLVKVSPLPLISIVDATIDEILRRGLKKVLLTGTLFTMQNGFYEKSLQRCGVTCQVPNDADKDKIHHIIFPELENGIIRPEKREQFAALCTNYIDAGAEAVILGCTELPLLIHDNDLLVPVLDTMQIHLDAIVREMYKS